MVFLKRTFISSRQKLNNADYSRSYLSYKDVMNGGDLSFTMSDKPNKNWGTGSGNYPVQLISENQINANPFISSGNTQFEDKTTLTLSTIDEDAKIYYTTEAGVPLTHLQEYSGPMHHHRINNTILFLSEW